MSVRIACKTYRHIGFINYKFRLSTHRNLRTVTTAAGVVRKEVFDVKRVQAACILQTLVFQQKDDSYLSKEKKIALNQEEVEKYKASLQKHRTRFQIVEENEQDDGSILIRVRKQYNEKTDVAEYFN